MRRKHPDDHLREVAASIRRDPALLSIALENLDRWEAWGRVKMQPVHEWRRQILAARESPQKLEQILEFLETPNHDSEPIKSCSPFVGIPVEEEAAMTPRNPKS